MVKARAALETKFSNKMELMSRDTLEARSEKASQDACKGHALPHGLNIPPMPPPPMFPSYACPALDNCTCLSTSVWAGGNRHPPPAYFRGGRCCPNCPDHSRSIVPFLSWHSPLFPCHEPPLTLVPSPMQCQHPSVSRWQPRGWSWLTRGCDASTWTAAIRSCSSQWRN